MVRPIMRDPVFLAGKSEPATEADKQVVQDLLDTLRANQERCVGIDDQCKDHEAEGCLSLDGEELNQRYSDRSFVMH